MAGRVLARPGAARRGRHGCGAGALLALLGPSPAPAAAHGQPGGQRAAGSGPRRAVRRLRTGTTSRQRPGLSDPAGPAGPAHGPLKLPSLLSRAYTARLEPPPRNATYFHDFRIESLRFNESVNSSNSTTLMQCWSRAAGQGVTTRLPPVRSESARPGQVRLSSAVSALGVAVGFRRFRHCLLRFRRAVVLFQSSRQCYDSSSFMAAPPFASLFLCSSRPPLGNAINTHTRVVRPPHRPAQTVAPPSRPRRWLWQ